MDFNRCVDGGNNERKTDPWRLVYELYMDIQQQTDENSPLRLKFKFLFYCRGHKHLRSFFSTICLKIIIKQLVV